jgi:coiled-coil domain-containing protein 151
MGLTSDSSKEHYDEAKEKKMAEYEETMRLIKEATGVSDINEVIAKFQSQGDTHNHLAQLQTQNELKIEELRQKKADVLSEFEELKYTGESKNTHSQRLIEDFQQHLDEVHSKTLDSKQKTERVTKLLTNTKAGIQHLCDKLEAIQIPDQPSKISMSDETVKQILDLCVSKLELLATSVQGKELPEVKILKYRIFF